MAEWGFSTVGFFRTISDMDELADNLQSDKTYFIGVNLDQVPYARYVEFGMGPGEREPQPYVRDSWKATQAKFGGTSLNEIVNRYGDMDTFLRAAAEFWKVKMKEFAPVDTGNLMRSIHIEEL